MCVNVVVCLLVRLLLPFSAELHGTLGVEISSNNLLRNAIAPDVTRAGTPSVLSAVLGHQSWHLGMGLVACRFPLVTAL